MARRLLPLTSDERRARCEEAVRLFNAAHYWEAHEAIEAVWRSVGDGAEARVLQGLIQAAAALLHRERGNRHGVEVVGRAALLKLDGDQHPVVEFETVEFRRELERSLESGTPAPVLRLRSM